MHVDVLGLGCSPFDMTPDSFTDVFATDRASDLAVMQCLRDALVLTPSLRRVPSGWTEPEP